MLVATINLIRCHGMNDGNLTWHDSSVHSIIGSDDPFLSA